MGKKLERVGEVAGSVAAALNLWERFQRWRRARAARLAEERQLELFELERRREHEMNLISDNANAPRGLRCEERGCERPRWHSICQCGRKPCPGNHGAKLQPWATPP